ncbi:MAG TPA: hypothetical protein VIU33_07245 [Nitrospiria bacterium]
MEEHDHKLSSVSRLVGMTMFIMGFFTVLISWTNSELDLMPVLMVCFGAGLFVHSSVDTWHKWVVLAVLACALLVFMANPSPLVKYWYKTVIFYGTIVMVVFFMLTHKIKPSHDNGTP